MVMNDFCCESYFLKKNGILIFTKFERKFMSLEKVEELKNKIEQTQVQPASSEKNLFDIINNKMSEITETWNKSDRQACTETILQLYNSAKNDPEIFNILRANVPKAMQLFVKAASLKLHGSPDNLFYFVRFKNNLTLLVSYKGLLELAYRSGLETVIARPVHENDEFFIDYGNANTLVHKPSLKGNKGEIMGFYAKAKLNGQDIFEYSSIEELVNYKNKFSRLDREGKNNFWDNHFDEMAKKTMVRKLIKYAPKLRKLDLPEEDEEFTSDSSPLSAPVYHAAPLLDQQAHDSTTCTDLGEQH